MLMTTVFLKHTVVATHCNICKITTKNIPKVFPLMKALILYKISC